MIEFVCLMLIFGFKLWISSNVFCCIQLSIFPYHTLILTSLFCFVLSFVIGSNVGGIGIVILIIFLLYYGWESFFICHQVLCINHAPEKELISLMLLLNFMFMNAGCMVGTQISPMLWDGGDGLYIINTIWVICVSLTALKYIIFGIYYHMYQFRTLA